MERINLLSVAADLSIKAAWKKLNANGYKILFVLDKEGHLQGSITDGDIRRWVLEEGSISEPVQKVMCANPIIVHEYEDKNQIKKKMLDHRVECIPVVNDVYEIKRVVFWDDFFGENEVHVGHEVNKVDVPVVIMAGGRGERLAPFTKIIPKSLFPIGDKPVIEVIMDKFNFYGVQNFFVSVNYKSNMIKAYFQDGASGFSIQYLHEEFPMGTAGSLSLLQNQIDSTFIVSNSDIIVDANYADIVDFHKKNKYKITLVCSLKHFPIPYGIVEIENGGTLKKISEKPELDYLVLTGIYVLEPELIRMIPKDREYHITHLIEQLRLENHKIGVYPVADKAWVDIGEMAAYREALKNFE